MATGVDIDKHLFNSLHRLIALIEPGVGSNFERPLLAQSGHWLTSTDGGGFDAVKKTKDLNVPWRLARISHASYVGADDRLGRGRKIGIARLVIGLLPATAYFADAARRAGLKVVVNMSQISAREDSKSYAARDHWIAERLFDWSGVPTVHLRPTFFSEWLSLPFVRATIVENGIIDLPYGDGRHAPIAAEDHARVIATILAKPAAHVGKTYTLCGPTELDQAGIAAAISEVLGRKISYEPLTIPQYRERLEKAGLSEFMIQHFVRGRPRL
jgi:hypothetical protein